MSDSVEVQVHAACDMALDALILGLMVADVTPRVVCVVLGFGGQPPNLMTRRVAGVTGEEEARTLAWAAQRVADAYDVSITLIPRGMGGAG